MANEGWVCPLCGSVYAPWQYKCTTCPTVTNNYGGVSPSGVHLVDYCGRCGRPKNLAATAGGCGCAIPQ